jgi:hypothetical protein
MAICPACQVEHVDRQCTHSPSPLCYRCCTTGNGLTCPAHFHQMGNVDKAARLATRLVHESLLDDIIGQPHPPAGGPPLGQQLPGNVQSQQVDPAVAVPLLPPALPASASSAPPDFTALLATLTQLSTSMTELRIAVAEGQRETQQLRAALAAARPSSPPQSAPPQSPPPQSAPPTAAIPQTLAAILPRIPMSPASLPEMVSPPSAAHRSAVLDRSASHQAELANLINRFAPLAPQDDSDTDDHQVPSPSHTHTARPTPSVTLPAAFVPTSIGTGENALQALQAIVKTVVDKGSTSHIKNIKQLDELLDDWATDWVKAGTYTSRQVESVRAYQRLLILQFTISERRPFTEVLEYHRRWCKAVHAGTIDMFADGAELNLTILHKVSTPIQYASHGSSSSPPPRGHKAKADKTPTKATPGGGSSTPAKFPAGSCTYHPNSTSHTTEHCKTKGRA